MIFFFIEFKWSIRIFVNIVLVFIIDLLEFVYMMKFRFIVKGWWIFFIVLVSMFSYDVKKISLFSFGIGVKFIDYFY